MLLREAGDGTVWAIGQTAHSAIAGRFASAWAERPLALAPGWPELALAAAIHDLAWGAWDAAPRLHAATGRPHSFRDIPDEQWAGIWAQAPALAAPYGRAVELWVLRHAARLMRRDRGSAVRATRAAISERLAALEPAVAADPLLALGADAVAAGTALLARWDGLSLVLCHGLDAPLELDGCTLSPLAGLPDRGDAAVSRDARPPASGRGDSAGGQTAAPPASAGGDSAGLRDAGLLVAVDRDTAGSREAAVPLSASPAAGGPRGGAAEVDVVAVAPWPFAVPRLELRADARVLGKPVADQDALDAAWAGAELRTLAVDLVPG